MSRSFLPLPLLALVLAAAAAGCADTYEVASAASSGACTPPNKPTAFLSSSATAEVALFEKLYPFGVPANANLMQDLIAAIRAGTIDLTSSNVPLSRDEFRKLCDENPSAEAIKAALEKR